MKYDPFETVRALEKAIADYTGAPHVVTVNSCSMALLLALAWHNRNGRGGLVNIPKRTYVSVPMSAKHAGFGVRFRDEAWQGFYQIKPFNVFDSARCFTSDMYNKFPADSLVCVSLHVTKILGDTQGGAILCADAEQAAWFRRARFDGRTEGVAPINDEFTQLGWHCYMSPDVAARLIHRLAILPPHNAPLPNDNYPDLSKWSIFK